MKDKLFFETMNELIEDAPSLLQPHHITVERFCAESKKANKPMQYRTALEYLRKKESEKKLVFVGKVKSPVSGRAVNAWVKPVKRT